MLCVHVCVRDLDGAVSALSQYLQLPLATQYNVIPTAELVMPMDITFFCMSMITNIKPFQVRLLYDLMLL